MESSPAQPDAEAEGALPVPGHKAVWELGSFSAGVFVCFFLLVCFYSHRTCSQFSFSSVSIRKELTVVMSLAAEMDQATQVRPPEQCRPPLLCLQPGVPQRCGIPSFGAGPRVLTAGCGQNPVTPHVDVGVSGMLHPECLLSAVQSQILLRETQDTVLAPFWEPHGQYTYRWIFHKCVKYSRKNEVRDKKGYRGGSFMVRVAKKDNAELTVLQSALWRERTKTWQKQQQVQGRLVSGNVYFLLIFA